MNPPLANCIAKPNCYCSLQEICQALQTLSSRASGLIPGDLVRTQALKRIAEWCDARELGLARVLSSLDTDTETADLLRDWLAHAPPPLIAANGGSDRFTALCLDVAALEEHLRLLFSTLMQQGDSTWARDLYKDLLNHQAPVPALNAWAARPFSGQCSPPN